MDSMPLRSKLFSQVLVLERHFKSLDREIFLYIIHYTRGSSEPLSDVRASTTCCIHLKILWTV